MNSDAQKSEVHATTDDAATSPASEGGRRLAGEAVEREGARATKDELRGTAGGKPGDSATPREELFPEGIKVKRDDSDAGGPIVIETEEI